MFRLGEYTQAQLRKKYEKNLWDIYRNAFETEWLRLNLCEQYNNRGIIYLITIGEFQGKKYYSLIDEFNLDKSKLEGYMNYHGLTLDEGIEYEKKFF